MTVGCLLLFCYILRSESYIMVWCGDKDAWTDVNQTEPEKCKQAPGSFSDSGASRITSSSAQHHFKSVRKESFRASVTFPGKER